MPPIIDRCATLLPFPPELNRSPPYSYQRDPEDPEIGNPNGDVNRSRKTRQIVRARRVILLLDSFPTSAGETSGGSEIEELTRPIDDLRNNCVVYMLQEAPEDAAKDESSV